MLDLTDEQIDEAALHAAMEQFTREGRPTCPTCDDNGLVCGACSQSPAYCQCDGNSFVMCLDCVGSLIVEGQASS